MMYYGSVSQETKGSFGLSTEQGVIPTAHQS